jgi:RNA polymerase sigma factor (TIGR02999 family)
MCFPKSIHERRLPSPFATRIVHVARPVIASRENPRHSHTQKEPRERHAVYTRAKGLGNGTVAGDEVAALIDAAGKGDADALKALFARVYDELKVLARKQLQGSSDATLSTTGLVHEAYLKLVHPEGFDLRGRVHFFALAAKAMRQIVIDRARARIADKRGGGQLQIVELDEAAEIADSELGPEALLRLDRALTELANDEPRLAELVELRFFAGLQISDIAALREVSDRTLNRDWRRAKAMLHAALFPDT